MDQKQTIIKNNSSIGIVTNSDINHFYSINRIKAFPIIIEVYDSKYEIYHKNQEILILCKKNQYKKKLWIQNHDFLYQEFCTDTKKKDNLIFQFSSSSENKKEGFSKINLLLSDMKGSSELEEKIVYNAYQKLYLLPKNSYMAPVKDEIISLNQNLSRYSFQNPQANDIEMDIILNDTLEKVGIIIFYISDRNQFSYDGNVYFEIYKKYRNQGYGKRALSLFKKYLTKQLNIQNEKLYLSIFPNDLISEKMIKMENGTLIYEGKVEKNERGLEQVKVYQISLK